MGARGRRPVHTHPSARHCTCVQVLQTYIGSRCLRAMALLGFDGTYVGVPCNAFKYENGYRNGGHDNFLLNCNVDYKKHILV